MVLLWAESMAKYDPAVDADLYNDNFDWSGTVDAKMIASVGRFGGNALEIDSRFSTPPLRIPFATAGASGTTIIIGVAFRFAATDAANADPYGFLEFFTTATAGSQHFSLAMLPSSTFVLFPATGNGIVIPNAFYNRTWHWLELKIVLLDAGSYELRIDGVVAASGSGDFRSGTGDTSTLGYLRVNGADNAGVDASMRYDDLVVMDGSGSFFNNFMGDLRLENTIPNADGATANWTPLSSTNVSNIDDLLAAYDDDTTYIHSSTDDQINMAAHADHTLSGAGTIHFAKLAALARNDGTKNVAPRVVSGGTGADGPTATLGTAYKWCNAFWYQDPNTSAAWTLTNINAAEWGVKLKA